MPRFIRAGRRIVPARSFAGYYTTGNPELYITANALATSTFEADATTGITSTGLGGTGANVFESQASVVNNSSFAIHTDANDTPTSGARFNVDFNGLLTVGTSYTISVDARHIGTGDDWTISLSSSVVAVDNEIKRLANTDTTWATYTLSFTYSANHRYLVVREYNPSNDGGIYVDNLSIKQR